jgi:hypothetical protein
MTTQYIVKFCKNMEISNQMIDGFVELNKNQSNYNFIEVRTMKDTNNENNVIILHKIITNNFAIITYDDDSMECILEYKDHYTTSFYIKSIIKFDNSSSSAYSEFKKNLTEMSKTQIETVYYPNGRIWYIGDVLHVKEGDKLIDRLAHGNGTWYYDGIGSKIKYQGECENGIIDGSGIFYSYDSKISLCANNISNGIPTQKGKLCINYNKNSEIIEINFTELFDELPTLKRKEDKINFVRSDNFVKHIAKLYWKNGEPIERTIFREQTPEDKQVELWNKINDLNDHLSNLVLDSKNDTEKYHKKITLIICFATLTIIFVQILLHMLK